MRVLTAALALTLAAPATAQDANAPATPAGKDALDILTKGIAFQTVEKKGQVPAYAAFLKRRLVAAGYADADVKFVPVGETGYLTARLPGRDRAAKPLLLLGHMDVVAADPKDWTRDPFTAVVENGYVYGRGALDNKGDVSIVVATLVKLKHAGWVPKRDVLLVLSGDEETMMETTKAAAAALGKTAGLVLNMDAGGGELDNSGKPMIYGLQAAEKTYADFGLTVTDPGGHSSRPTPTNPIMALNRALARIDAYRFPVESNGITRAYMEAAAPRASADLAPALRAFAANPKDEKAAATLSATSEYMAQLRTTCVTTMINGGHATNALPQRAYANINCRIFPGTTRASVMAKLTELVADPRVKIEQLAVGSVESPASELTPAVTAAVKAAVAARAPGTPVVPMMEAGATNSMHFRALGVPSYGVSGIFMKSSDMFAHGLNERLPIATLDPGVAHWEALLKALG